ncbi:MAG: hypothetical protein GC164_10030 [Phycisphaera sp.]|nr:hypothetical protein [Phycisphaera sp.]
MKTPTPQTRNFRRLGGGMTAWALALSAIALAAGCTSAPRGDSGGRIDPYETTQADRNSGYISLPALLEATDTAAEQLAGDIVDVLAGANSRKVLEVGTINNMTSTPSNDFRMIVTRLKAKLRSSPVIRNNLMFVESRSRVDNDLQRLNGGGGDNGDILQETGPNTGSGSATYNPQDMVILYGEFMEASRGSRRTYFYEFKLVNPTTREEIWAKSYDLSLK